jgi:hypothetical protein
LKVAKTKREGAASTRIALTLGSRSLKKLINAMSFKGETIPDVKSFFIDARSVTLNIISNIKAWETIEIDWEGSEIPRDLIEEQLRKLVDLLARDRMKYLKRFASYLSSKDDVSIDEDMRRLARTTTWNTEVVNSEVKQVETLCWLLGEEHKEDCQRFKKLLVLGGSYNPSHFPQDAFISRQVCDDASSYRSCVDL